MFQAWAFQFGYIASIIQAVKRSKGMPWDEIKTQKIADVQVNVPQLAKI